MGHTPGDGDWANPLAWHDRSLDLWAGRAEMGYYLSMYGFVLVAVLTPFLIGRGRLSRLCVAAWVIGGLVSMLMWRGFSSYPG